MTPPDSRAIVTTRVVDAPRERVFAAWTDPVHVSNWWGPRGFTTTTIASDFRVGGLWRFVMHGPDGTDYDNRILYREIVRPSRLAYLHGSDKDNDPEAFEATVTFEEEEGKTRITLRCVLPTQAQRDMAVQHGAIEGANDTLARFEEQLALSGPAKPLIISRTFKAPRALVWKAWTDWEHLSKWFGPKGFTVIASKLELKPGGIYHYGLRGPNGDTMWGKWTFREILAPDRLVLISSFSDEAGGTTRHPLSATWPLETLSVMTLEEKDGDTTLRLTWAPWKASEAERTTFDGAHAGIRHGWSGTMEQLENFLYEGRQIVSTRVVKAPREKVWKAWTDPGILAKWWGPKGFTNTFHKFEPQPGGVWEFDMQGPDGKRYPNRSVFLELTEPSRIVLDHLSGHYFRVTATFDPVEEGTRITFRMVFETPEERERVVKIAGPGNEELFDRLEAQLALLG